MNLSMRQDELSKIFLRASELFKIGDYQNASVELKRAYELQPNSISILINLSSVLIKTGNQQEALFLINKGFNLEPQNYDLLLNYATILMLNNKIIESINILEKISIANPKRNEAFVNLGRCYSLIHEYNKSIENFKKAIIIKANPKNITSLLFAYNFLDNYNPNAYLQYALEFRRNLKLLDSEKIITPQYLSKKIKIGFVSSDLKKNHPVGHFLLDFLKEIKNYFELYAYYNSEKIKKLTLEFEYIFDSWTNINKVNDLDVVNKIRKDGINVLIDLNGHTDNNRLSIFPNKPAPIQITWCGYLNTTGIKEINYIIGDPYVTPKKNQKYYSEEILQMPKIWNCFTRPTYEGIIINKTTPAIKNKFITFGYFNSPKKISNTVILVFSKILRETQNSKIIFLGKDFDINYVKERFFKEFTKFNINYERLIIKGQLERKDLLLLYNDIDISLDTFPYSGGTTSFEASYMGVPLLTLKGNNFLENCGVSINHNINMENWIAENKEEYVKKGIQFASNINSLNLLRKNHHEKVISSSLFNCSEFAKDFKNKIYEICKTKIPNLVS
jgi:predicted O-linked N-acetylglucosamine transferase (SPINDLY family)